MHTSSLPELITRFVTMKAVVEVAIYPIGTGSTSFSQQCKQCVQVFKQRGLKHSVHATGTDVEGELDDIMMAVQEAQQQRKFYKSFYRVTCY